MKKYLLAILLVSVYYSSSFAFVSTTPSEKLYKFKYNIQGQTLQYEQKAQSYEDAMEKVAVQCFKELKGHGRVSEEKGLDIIDICANPRTI